MTPAVRAGIWTVVLIKDFAAAKTRLGPALSPASRRRLARATAERALGAAAAAGPALAVCASTGAAQLARSLGVEALLEEHPSGQNPAAQLGVSTVACRGARSAIVLSSDLPLVTAEALARLVAAASGEGPVWVAAAAAGRAGTNALLLRPPLPFSPQFGAGSLARFAAEAHRSGRRFAVHRDPTLALDLDEPADLQAWQRLRTA